MREKLIHSIRQGRRVQGETGRDEGGEIICSQFTKGSVGCVEDCREIPLTTLRISSHLL